MNLKELSSLLGLSQTTVSRALNGYPEVSEATRERVIQVARDNNYRPNTRAKGLATGRAMTIGHVIPVSTQHEMVNPIFSDFIAGAGEVYARNGYDMHLAVVADTDQDRVYRELAVKGSVDGIIVHGPVANDPRIRLLTDIGLPFAVHGRAGLGDDAYTWVDVNNAAAFKEATAYLLSIGHHRIALVNGLESMDFARRRREGYLAALSAHGIGPDKALMFSDEMTEYYGYNSANLLLDLPDPPSAILCSSIITAIGLRRAVQDRGYRLGRDISIVTHDDELSYLRNGESTPIFTATRSSVREAGKLCAEALMQAIFDRDAVPVQTLLQAELVVGGSTGPGPFAQPAHAARQKLDADAADGRVGRARKG